MKTKTLLFSLVLLTSTLSATSPLLISEDFASDAWQAELLAKDPAYVLPATTAATYAAKDDVLYMEKYKLNGAIMIDGVTSIRTCADSIAHPENGIEHKESSSKHAVAFRFRGAKPVPNVGTYMEFPSLPNAGLMTLHVRNGNATAAAILELQQYNEIESTWSIIKTFDLKPYGEVNIASLDEIVTFDVNSPSEIKLRLIGGPKFIYMYRVDIAAYEASGLNTVKTSSFKLAGRILTTSTPVAISLFNSIGVKVFEKTIQNEVDFPASLGKGIFFVKSELGTQKIFLN